MAKVRRLTKSRFKMGSECPTKLYFNDREEYGNNQDSNEFMKALAEGGFQVGELAKLYYKGGLQVDTLHYEESLKATNELLKRDNVIIYEAALGYKDLFVRVDILVKNRNHIELIEVKSKSFDSRGEFEPFNKIHLKKNRYVLKAEWEPYLLDIAFQTYVARMAHPHWTFHPFLMMADKSRIATVGGLNQRFLLKRDGDGRPTVSVKDPNAPLGEPILERMALGETIDTIISRGEFELAKNFEELIGKLDEVMKSPIRIVTAVGAQCKSCEFRFKEASDPASNLKSGFDECWKSEKGLTAEQLKKEFVFDVWDFRSSARIIREGKVFGSDLDEEDIKLKSREDDLLGLSRTERQLIQINSAKGMDNTFYFDTEGFKVEIEKFIYPLHFIDFETTMVAIPFHAGRHPYEQMAFQFSHHILYADGRYEHKTEYLDDRKGVFPNFDFVRALRKALNQDNGTVFRFAAHENTVLNQIREQLVESQESDKDELVGWIESLTTPPENLENPWVPTRQFVDMRDLTLRFYYLPETRGSNSIKKILPAALNVCRTNVLQKFSDWIKRDVSGRVIDPYTLLPPIFSDIDPNELAQLEQYLTDREDLNDGGAAMMAWARMQFSEMSEAERQALRKALLRYCKLDTLAMVILYEWWRDEIAQKSEKGAA